MSGGGGSEEAGGRSLGRVNASIDSVDSVDASASPRACGRGGCVEGSEASRSNGCYGAWGLCAHTRSRARRAPTFAIIARMLAFSPQCNRRHGVDCTGPMFAAQTPRRVLEAVGAWVRRPWSGIRSHFQPIKSLSRGMEGEGQALGVRSRLDRGQAFCSCCAHKNAKGKSKRRVDALVGFFGSFIRSFVLLLFFFHRSPTA